MYEELYIIDNGKRLRVDLSIPSGITLNFKSNIFGDLSKITCSYTYTFKLPLTANNRRVLDNADDIRSQSNMIRRRLKCEYIQNGIPLFSNANLYIDSTENCFNAIMTWGVVDGFQDLKDNDCSLAELPNDNTETTFGPFELNENTSSTPSRGDGGISDTGETTHNFDNLALVLGPDYNCGIPHRKWKIAVTTGYRSAGWSTYFGTLPMPVVPVYKIIQLINQKFGTHFLLGKHITTENISTLNPQQEAIEVGVIPLVSTNLNSVQLAKRVGTFTGIKFEYINANLSETAGDTTTSASFPDAITFTSFSCESQDYFGSGSFGYSNSGTSGTTRNNVGPAPKVSGMSLELDGHLRLTFTEYYSTRGHSAPTDPPELIVYQRRYVTVRGAAGSGAHTSRRPHYEWVEVCSLTGEADGKSGDYTIYDFNFSADEMFERLKCDNLKTNSCSPLLFAFSARIKAIEYSTPIKAYLVNSTQGAYKFDVISNLPDISVMAFVKSLYYMIGAFPTTNSQGEILPVFYSDIRKNLIEGKALDWSNKIQSDIPTLPQKIVYARNEYAQKNYYKMKSDKDSDGEESDDKQVFYAGSGVIEVENGTIEQSKTIIQLPFYAPLKYDKENPNYDMGETFRCWSLEEENGKKVKKWVDPKPCFGLIRDREYYKSTDGGPYTVAGTVMSMIVWNGFAAILDNESYQYLQRIVRKPFVITENLQLNEHDLRTLDYSVPVYLSKYGAFFAVVSITRDSKGISKCELLKLPEEE